MLVMELPVRRIHNSIGRHSLLPFLLLTADRTMTGPHHLCWRFSYSSQKKTRRRVVERQNEKTGTLGCGHLRGRLLHSTQNRSVSTASLSALFSRTWLRKCHQMTEVLVFSRLENLENSITETYPCPLTTGLIWKGRSVRRSSLTETDLQSEGPHTHSHTKCKSHRNKIVLIRPSFFQQSSVVDESRGDPEGHTGFHKGPTEFTTKLKYQNK